jgi:hypothetical protein
MYNHSLFLLRATYILHKGVLGKIKGGQENTGETLLKDVHGQ